MGDASAKREPGAFVAVLLVMVAAWLLEEMLEELTYFSIIFLSNKFLSVLVTVLAILFGTCTVQLILPESVAFLNLSAKVLD